MRRGTIIPLIFIAQGGAVAAGSALYLVHEGIPLYWLAIAAVGAACLGVIIDLIFRWKP